MNISGGLSFVCPFQGQIRIFLPVEGLKGLILFQSQGSVQPEASIGLRMFCKVLEAKLLEPPEFRRFLEKNKSIK